MNQEKIHEWILSPALPCPECDRILKRRYKMNLEDVFRLVNTSIHFKICPDCNRSVEVEPGLNWEILPHWKIEGTRAHTCPGTGKQLPEGSSIKRFIIKLDVDTGDKYG